MSTGRRWMNKMALKFYKNWIDDNGKRIRVRYHLGSYTKESGLPEGTITIYAKVILS